MKTILMLTAFALIAGWSTIALAEDSNATAPTPAPVQQQDSTTSAPCEKQENLTAGRNECWSGRGCSGRILNHRDRHNCKNSGGHSWRDGQTGRCYNL